MSDEAKIPIIASEDLTVCALITAHPDGSYTLQFHGPVEEKLLELIRAFAGPVIVESILSADDQAALAALGVGVTMVMPEAA